MASIAGSIFVTRTVGDDPAGWLASTLAPAVGRTPPSGTRRSTAGGPYVS